MVSLSDHDDLPMQKTTARKLTFTFINGSGDTRKFEAVNVSDAWVCLSFHEEAEVEVLVEQGWRVKFK